jgi:hypothetical protein
MKRMETKLYGNAYRNTLICVDDSQHGRFSGRLYNPYHQEGRRFEGVMDFLGQMELLLDSLKLPQSFTAKRSFGNAVPLDGEVPEEAPRKGREATFSLRVLFRQNASWQGSVTWMESQKEQLFRSVLELLMLIRDALPREDRTERQAALNP